MAFKVGDSLGEHAVVHNLQVESDNPDPTAKHRPRDNFGYREFDIPVGSKLGDFEVFPPETEGTEEVWVHVDGSPEGTSNVAWLKSTEKAPSPKPVLTAPGG